MNRRNFFAGAATAVAATTVSRVSMAALPEPAYLDAVQKLKMNVPQKLTAAPDHLRSSTN